MTEETNKQNMDFGFFDEFLAKSETLEAKDILVETTKKKEFFPTCFTYTPGTYKFRVYPEVYNERLRYCRDVWYHPLMKKGENGKPYRFNAVPKKDDTRINDLINAAESAGFKKGENAPWKHKLKRVGVLFGHIYDSPEGKYTTEGTSAIILEYKALDAFNELMDRIEKREGHQGILNLINPKQDAPAFSLTVSPDRKKYEMSLTGGFSDPVNFELPETIELPGGFKYEGLDNLYMKEGTYLTDEQFLEFKDYFDEQVQQYLEFQDSMNSANKNTESGYNIREEENNLGNE